MRAFASTNGMCCSTRLVVQVKESKEEKKAREKARKKEKDAAKKVAPPAAGVHSISFCALLCSATPAIATSQTR